MGGERARHSRRGTGQVPGLVMWIGDSLTRDPALGAWAQNGDGKTAEDQMITTWMHAGQSPQGIDSIDGFALATPYFCPARSFTVGDGLGSWHFMGASACRRHQPDHREAEAAELLDVSERAEPDARCWRRCRNPSSPFRK